MQNPARLKTRPPSPARPIGLARLAGVAAVLAAVPVLSAQAPQPAQGAGVEARPVAIVPIDATVPGAAAEVTGGVQVSNGRAFIAANGTITSGSETAQVTLPYRGTLRVCASTTVKLTADSSVPAGEIPGLLMAMDHGAVEASFATGRNSDFVLTPDFRILISGPGAAEVKVRLGLNGDTCVDNAEIHGDSSSPPGRNAGVNAPYVLVTSVFDGGAYRVQAGQRVMFQHGSLREVVDQEKEPCGCPPAGKGGNDFPLAQSEGLAPTLSPGPIPKGQLGHEAQTTETLAYNAAEHAPASGDAAQAAAAPAAAQPAAVAPVNPAENAAANPPGPQKKPGLFKRVGKFFRKVFGAD
jgi:hypothetical protein